jgi:hypothetical protein
MTGYPLEQLHEEVAYIAYHFHWELDTLFNLPHIQRREWVKQIASINRRIYQSLPTERGL